MNSSIGTDAADTESLSTSDAILDATLQVLGERGLKGATTRLIAQRADVNEVTLFRKFGTKNKLIQAAIEQKFATVQRTFGGYTGDIEADLTRLTQTYLAALKDVGPVVWVVFTELSYNQELARSIHGPERLFATVAEMMQRYQSEGVLRDEPPQTMVPAFIGPILMPFVVKSVADSFGLTLEIDVQAHVSGFLHGRVGSSGAPQ
ncbi:MAG: TetR/AcrR family transcriptional regulator [Propionicimonas sp.]|uniref:TetR/AcrR family transcriptional regulator n=1 Tax=Propionicimonas sp. TaxID=1955623 RepID=UPI003D0DAAC0